MPKTYLFYDLETTGRNKCFDQALQFAAIRTDLELNELERHEIQIKLNCDVIPDPEALLIHNIPVTSMLEGTVEMAAMEEIYTLLNTPGTQSGGYNTLGFDDEFLRFSFYRNLLPAYNHQWANDCGRFDLYPITVLYFLYKNAAITWPELDGKPTLKLEHINAANQLADGAAHNALVDVEATLGLARLFARDAQMWNYAMGYFDKQAEANRIKKLPTWSNHSGEQQYLGLLLGKCGANEWYQYPVLSLGQHNHYKNQSLWLRLDKPELSTMTKDSVAETSWVARKKMGEPGMLLPMAERFTQRLTAERLQITADNLQWLQYNPHLLQEVTEFHREYTYPKIPELDPQAALYEAGFLKPYEQQLCQLFHRTKPESRAQLTPQFVNPILQQIMLRAMGRNYPEYLPVDLAEQFNEYLIAGNSLTKTTDRVDYRGEKRLAPQAALAAINSLGTERTLNDKQQELLADLAGYIQKL